MAKRGFTINLKLIRQLREDGIKVEDFLNWVITSIPIKSKFGNRRCREWYFTVAADKSVVSYRRVLEDEDPEARETAYKYSGAVIVPPHATEEQKKARREEPALPISGQYRCPSCKDTQQVEQHDDCPYCDGKGCSKCGKRGYTIRKLSCPDCQPQGLSFVNTLKNPRRI